MYLLTSGHVLRETGQEGIEMISRLATGLLLAGVLPVGSAGAATFADQVVQYTPGTGVGSLTQAAAALGSPDGITGEGLGFDNVLSPFSPAFEADELVRIGAGGSLTLRLERFVEIGAGLDLGVVTNVGLIDPAFPSGTTGGPAGAFGVDSATVEVSEDGVGFVSLGAVTFDGPGNFYLNAGPFDTVAPDSPQTADFGKPFDGQLSDFDGKASYADVLAVLDGSGGGTWLDLSSTGLTQVGYIRFSNPTNTLEIDAVVIANGKEGALVPEPATLAMLGIGLAGVGYARRRKAA